MNTDSNRRGFIKTGAGAAAAGLTSAAAARAADGAAGRLRIGIVGPGRRGFGTHLKSLAKLRRLGRKLDIVAVNDVYTVHRDRAVDFIKSKTGVTPKTFADYREMIDGDHVDAVCIATPDHWHAKQTRDALEAGKHVYCEKPMTHTTDEAKEVVRAWKRSGRAMQVGVQLTSLPVWDRAREMIGFANWLDAIESGRPETVHNDPELGAAAIMIVNLAVRSYREGKVFHVDRGGNVSDGNPSWAERWEKLSKAHAEPRHVPGWHAGDAGSVLHPPEYQKLAGPWIDGKPPEQG